MNPWFKQIHGLKTEEKDAGKWCSGKVELGKGKGAGTGKDLEKGVEKGVGEGKL